MRRYLEERDLASAINELEQEAQRVLAAATEFAQIYFPPRTVSANDILVEGAGVLGGCAAWLLAGRRFSGWLRDFWNRRGLGGDGKLRSADIVRSPPAAPL